MILALIQLYRSSRPGLLTWKKSCNEAWRRLGFGKKGSEKQAAENGMFGELDDWNIHGDIMVTKTTWDVSNQKQLM